MAVKAKYTQPLQVVATPEMRDRIVELADAKEVSQAQVIRELLNYALDTLHPG